MSIGQTKMAVAGTTTAEAEANTDVASPMKTHEFAAAFDTCRSSFAGGEGEGGGGTCSALLAASVATGLLASSATTCFPPAAHAAVDESSQLPSAGNPRAVRVEFRPGDSPKLPLSAPGAFARALYADRLEFLEAVKEVRTAVDEVRTTLTPALEDLAGPGSKVTVSPPRDVRGAVMDALSGQGTVVVNGEAVGVSVQSEEGALDVRVTSRVLPRIPFRPPPAEGTASASRRAAAPAVAPAVAPVVTAETAAVEGEDEEAESEATPSLWDGFVSFLGSPFALNEDITNLQAGEIATVPGVAAVYGISYQYYLSEVEREEKEAAEKKSKIAAKKKKKEVKADTDGKKKEEGASAETEDVTEPAMAPAPRSEPPKTVKVDKGPIALRKGNALADLYDSAAGDESAPSREGEPDSNEKASSKSRFAGRVLKKVIMPWKPFKNI